MEEAERLSDRVAIIDHGKVLVVGTPAGLKQSLGANTVCEVAVDRVDESLLRAIRALPTVHEVTRTERGVRVLTGSRDGLLPRLVEVALGYGLTDVAVHEPTLETVFIQITGRELRD